MWSETKKYMENIKNIQLETIHTHISYLCPEENI